MLPDGRVGVCARARAHTSLCRTARSSLSLGPPSDLPDLGTLALKGARKLGSMVSAARARRASASSNASSQSSATTSSTSSSLPSSVGACAVLVRPPMEEEEEEEEGISPPPSRPRSPPPPTAMDEDEDEDEQSTDMDSEFGGSSVVEEDEDEIGAPPSPPSVLGAPVEKRWHDLEGIGGAAGGVGTGSGEVTPRRRGSFSGTTDFPVHGHVRPVNFPRSLEQHANDLAPRLPGCVRPRVQPEAGARGGQRRRGVAATPGRQRAVMKRRGAGEEGLMTAVYSIEP